MRYHEIVNETRYPYNDPITFHFILWTLENTVGQKDRVDAKRRARNQRQWLRRDIHLSSADKQRMLNELNELIGRLD